MENDTRQLEQKSTWDKEVMFKFRKSKRIFYLLMTKIVILILFLITWFLIILTVVWDSLNGADYMIIKNVIWILFIIAIIYIFTLITSWSIKYFYDIAIFTNDKIYKFRSWLFMRDNIDVIDLYRVQRIKVNMWWFIKVFLNVWNIVIIEQNDMEKSINWIDNPKDVMMLVQKLKDKVIYKRN